MVGATSSEGSLAPVGCLVSYLLIWILLGLRPATSHAGSGMGVLRHVIRNIRNLIVFPGNVLPPEAFLWPQEYTKLDFHLQFSSHTLLGEACSWISKGLLR